MDSSQGAPVYTGAALGCSFCCGRGEVARKTKDLYLAKAPAGKEANWIPTKEGHRFFMLFRFYGPKPEIVNGSFELNDIEYVK